MMNTAHCLPNALAVFAAALLSSGIAFGPAGADVVSIPASQDNTLFEDVAGALSNGAGEELFSGNTSDQGVRRAVIAFDVAAAIPPRLDHRRGDAHSEHGSQPARRR
jgi:hypothetical protein